MPPPQRALRAMGEPLRLYQETHRARLERLNAKRNGGGSSSSRPEGEERETWLSGAKHAEEGGEGGGGVSLDSLISGTSSNRVKRADRVKEEAAVARADKPAFLQVLSLAHPATFTLHPR